MQVFQAIRNGVHSTLTLVLVIAFGAVVGIGVPLLWFWIGSQTQHTTAPSATAFAVVLIGIVFTLLLIGGFLSYFADRSRHRQRQRSDWMRGMTEERKQDSFSDMHPLEAILFCAVFVDIILFVVWFFAFADPGTPVGQG
jgi:hypothetical protein